MSIFPFIQYMASISVKKSEINLLLYHFIFSAAFMFFLFCFFLSIVSYNFIITYLYYFTYIMGPDSMNLSLISFTQHD